MLPFSFQKNRFIYLLLGLLISLTVITGCSNKEQEEADATLLGTGMHKTPSMKIATMTPTIQPTFLPTPSPIPDPTLWPGPSANPIRLTIEDIELDAEIVPVGLSEDNEINVLPEAERVSWLSYYVPGQLGNALLLGHNQWSKKPAVFKDLDKLEVGAKMTISYEDGTSLGFELYEIFVHDSYVLPTDVVDLYSEERTTLITCHGAFNSEIGTSESRVVAKFRRVVE